MVVEEVIAVLPVQVAERIGGLVTIFKAVGIAILIYIIYLLIVGFFTFKRIKRMRHIEKKVVAIDRKLDKLLKKKGKK
jgi:hypothetical protein